jgi:hypothetical protein
VGVVVNPAPSVENLHDGDEKAVLGLLWAIMIRFLKVGDDEDAGSGGVVLSPKDALLRWVQIQTEGYAHVDVKGFTKSFHDGMALCALMHKGKSALLDYSALQPENAAHNLQTAMDAAERYFGLEKYLSPADIAHLDEKSMMVYVSEYYQGCVALVGMGGLKR